MTSTILTSDLPVLLAGLPRTQINWIRAAGLPSVNYTTGRSFHEFLEKSPGRFVLYDSRNPTSRAEAETALQFEREIIDVSPNGLLDSQGYPSQHPYRYEELSAHRWVLLVQQEIRHHSGVWLRIHDLPAPYDAIIFTDGFPHQPELKLVAESLSVIRNSVCEPVTNVDYEVDHIFFAEESHENSQFGCWWITHPRRNATPEGILEDPTIWKVTSQQFARWWSFRQSISLEIKQNQEELRIVAPLADQVGWTPMVELWRKDHVARFPLTHSLVTLNRSSMVYGLDRFRHSAGLFLSQGRPMPTAPPVSVSA
ncbi:hypothetical protein OAE80_03230 [Planctomycetaceae bacterium]|nr:hypothetical protein [Planctomycetaceae bacterium]